MNTDTAPRTYSYSATMRPRTSVTIPVAEHVVEPVVVEADDIEHLLCDLCKQLPAVELATVMGVETRDDVPRAYHTLARQARQIAALAVALADRSLLAYPIIDEAVLAAAQHAAEAGAECPPPALRRTPA